MYIRQFAVETLQTVPEPEEGPTVTLKVLVAGVVKFSVNVVHVVVPAVNAALKPLTLTPRDVPVFFFIWKDNTAGVL